MFVFLILIQTNKNKDQIKYQADIKKIIPPEIATNKTRLIKHKTKNLFLDLR